RYDAKPVEPVMHRGNRVVSFRGGHSGYMRLPSPVSHTRECFVDTHLSRVLVRDRLEGGGEHTLVWRFHIDPSVTSEIDGCDVRLSRGGRMVWLLPDRVAARSSLSVEPGWVSPRYGIKCQTDVLVWSVRTSLP